jgi:1,4-dihydroxy-2-naphthoyl-CoA hydrolase
VLHGGASAALAESEGSVASTLCIDTGTHMAVGIEINANHLRPVAGPAMVMATARPLHLGKTTHVWDIRIENEAGKLVCISRLTVAIVSKPS